jgi:hypothetical protein
MADGGLCTRFYVIVTLFFGFGVVFILSHIATIRGSGVCC